MGHGRWQICSQLTPDTNRCAHRSECPQGDGCGTLVSRLSAVAKSDCSDYSPAMQINTRAVALTACDELARLGIRYQGFQECAAGTVRRMEAVGSRPIMVVSLGAPVSIASQGARPELLSAFCVGLGSHAMLSEHAGSLTCIEVSIPPLLAERIWPGMARNGAVPANELWQGAAIERLRYAADQQSLEAAAALLDHALVALIARRGHHVDEVATRIWHGLVASKGRARTGQLATAVGVSERHAIARFRQAAGITPKVAARRLRFAHARDRLTQGRESLADIAMACGYADQSHFTREFLMFAGHTPGTQWLG
jgi:AraC-like DNA-binding protein